MQLPSIHLRPMQEKQSKTVNKEEEEMFGLGIQVFKISSKKDAAHGKGRKPPHRDIIRLIQNLRKEKQVPGILPHLHRTDQKERDITMNNPCGKKLQPQPSNSKQLQSQHSKIGKKMQKTVVTVKKVPEPSNLNKTCEGSAKGVKIQVHWMLKSNHNPEHDVMVNFYVEQERKKKGETFIDQFIENSHLFGSNNPIFKVRAQKATIQDGRCNQMNDVWLVSTLQMNHRRKNIKKHYFQKVQYLDFFKTSTFCKKSSLVSILFIFNLPKNFFVFFVLLRYTNSLPAIFTIN